MKNNPTLMADAYKVGHVHQYPVGTQAIYSNFTPRKSLIPGIDRVVFFGLQGFIKSFCEDLFGEWFKQDEEEMVQDYLAFMDQLLGPDNGVGAEHIRALHRLDYLPLKFSALPEGALVPLRVPMFTVENTLPEFYWLTNYIESILSAEIWQPCTSATTAWHLRRLLDAAAERTGGDKEFVAFQGHDFSFRGMTSWQSAAKSGAGHLLSFNGTDTLPALSYIADYYDYGSNGFVGGSVPATEHSVMCAGGMETELDTFDRLLSIYPGGILSIVSDTWDLWKVLTEILPTLHDRIMAREGKLVVRPDSGDPVDILCGTARQFGAGKSNEERGVIELLWSEFGGTVNAAGFKELDSHIGAIYGDSITFERAREITERLEAKGFASTNVVLGVGSFTYQYVTRDTFGFAMKATWAKIDGVGHDLAKDPVTDSGTKKSATGRLAVNYEDGAFRLTERATQHQEEFSDMSVVWMNGEFYDEWGFDEVRKNLRVYTEDYEAHLGQK